MRVDDMAGNICQARPQHLPASPALRPRPRRLRPRRPLPPPPPPLRSSVTGWPARRSAAHAPTRRVPSMLVDFCNGFLVPIRGCPNLAFRFSGLKRSG